VLKIGEFSSLAQVSITTLRHYDELGLLKPVHVDAGTGYRYYSVSQLPRLHRILALKDLGLPLERIAEALDEGGNAEAMRGMLLLRRVEMEEHIQDQVQRLARLQARLRHIEQEGHMTSDVVLKEVAPQWIASLREIIPAYRAIGALFGKLYGALGPLSAEGTGVALFHDTEYKEQNVDVEAGVYVKRSLRLDEPLRSYQLPVALVASTIHHGAFDHIGEAYGALLRWIETNGYHPAGPAREIFLHVSTPVSREDPSNVTEIQLPVAVAGAPHDV
jgi:DNA-binding transcriptional MerR regulator